MRGRKVDRSGAAGENAAALQIKDGEKSAWKWTWKKGDTTGLADFHAPDAGLAEYRLCLYDTSLAQQPLSQVGIPVGGFCDDEPCWKAAGTSGYKFRSKDALPDGIIGVTLKAGVFGKAGLSIKGKGSLLPIPPLPMTLPVVIQLVVDSEAGTECWQATFAETTANAEGLFKAKGK